MAWNPSEKPYYVRKYIRTNNPELHYWDCIVTEYATEAEARAAFDAPDDHRVRKVDLFRYYHIHLATRKTNYDNAAQLRAVAARAPRGRDAAEAEGGVR